MLVDSQTDDPLANVVSLADNILGLVQKHAPESVQSRDRNDQILVLAFGRAFRCFRSIRDLVAHHAEADDAFVLTRMLAAITFQALWIATPDDTAERIRRGRIATLRWYQETLRRADALARLDMPPDVPPELILPAADELEAQGVGGMPTDETIATDLGLEWMYARIYREGSDVAHFSIGAALQGFDASTITDPANGLDGVRIRFLDGQPERAGAVLALASVAYAAFLERSQPVVPHGIGPRVQQLIDEHATTFGIRQRVDPG